MRVVVFGAGYWGTNYIRELGRHCVGIVDPSEKARTAVRVRFGVNTYGVLPSSLEFDGAIVATPPQNHYEIALPLLAAGKYVLIEKPMTLVALQAKELAGYSRCMAGLVYLYHPVVAELRARVDGGMALSHIFSRRTNEGPVRPYMDAAWDLAPHDIAIFNYILSEERPAHAFSVSQRDWAVLSLEYSTVSAVAYVSWHGGPKTRKVELVPLEGDRVIFNDLEVVLEKSPLTLMVEAFLSGSWDRCYGEEGAAVVATLEALSNAHH